LTRSSTAVFIEFGSAAAPVRAAPPPLTNDFGAGEMVRKPKKQKKKKKKKKQKKKESKNIFAPLWSWRNGEKSQIKKIFKKRSEAK
jgi:hypothetical protein